jgi:hypothetical protein
MSKTKAAGIGIVFVIVGLAAIGISKLFTGGGAGLGFIGSTNSTGTPKAGNAGSGTAGPLVITIEGEQYLVDGSPRSLDDVVSAAGARSQTQSERSETQVLVKKKGNARYMTVLKLEEELKSRGIRYRSENDF